MKVECFRCWGTSWRASGDMHRNRFGRMVAKLKCDGCHNVFFSGRKEAIDAANAVRLELGDEPIPFEEALERPKPSGVITPQPSLPMLETMRPRHAEFVSMRQLVSSVARDFKMRQSGEREPGEDD